MKRMILLFCTVFYLFTLLLTGRAAFGAIDDPAPKENRTYTVNEEHLRQKAADEASRPSMLVSYIRLNFASEQPFMHKVYFLLYLLLPFAILGTSLWIEFTHGWGNLRQLFWLGLSEFLFAVGNAGIGANVFPWFCDYDLVGWIVAILCFCYLLRILIKQGLTFLGFVGGYSGGNWKKRLLFYVMYCAISFTVTLLLSGKSYFWLAPIAVVGVWYYFYRYERMEAPQAWRMLFETGVIFGGFLIFFMQVIGMILLIALLFTLLKGFASIQTSPAAADGAGPHDEGILDRAADGTPFVRHSDGSMTQLRDTGDGHFEDFNGNPWRDSGSGHLSR
ncbi:hypothetical protein [Alistipes sp.]|uniref:hypothetical protein n=1 Tax=Alistipes sp. TaxID=1872444 RepID=UPI003A8706B7